MVAMNSPANETVKILERVQKIIPTVSFEPARIFYWSPKRQVVGYLSDELHTDEGAWSLLHEVAHAQLEHTTYSSDFELLKLEAEAWQRAQKTSQELGIIINDDHVQDCLDTYRDWLHKRSTCPTCGSVGLQHTASEYQCHNCHSSWTVTTARFCRPYRRKSLTAKEKSPGRNQTTFH